MQTTPPEPAASEILYGQKSLSMAARALPLTHAATARSLELTPVPCLPLCAL